MWIFSPRPIGIDACPPMGTMVTRERQSMSNMETTQTPAPGDMPTPPSPVPAVQTRRVTVTVPPAGEISFLVADDPNGEVYFSLGVRKSGSTMLHRIVNVLARRAGLNTVDIPDAFFRRGLTVGDWSKVDLSELIRPGNVYVGYRTFPSNLGDNLLFQKAWKVFLFRDPRDAYLLVNISLMRIRMPCPRATRKLAERLLKPSRGSVNKRGPWALMNT